MVTDNRLTWVVPLIPRDLIYAKTLFDSLSNQSVPLDELVVVASGLSRTERATLKHDVGALTFANRVFFYPFLASAGLNRNRGARKASSRWISFFDADDYAHPFRNEFLKRAITIYGLEDQDIAVYHGYQKFLQDRPHSATGIADSLPSKLDWKVCEEIESGRRERLLADNLRPRRNRKGVLLKFEGTSWPGPCHGPVTIPARAMKKIRFRNWPLRVGEDVFFANDLLNNSYRLIHLDIPLLAYRIVSRTDHNLEIHSRQDGFWIHRTSRTLTGILVRMAKRTRNSVCRKARH